MNVAKLNIVPILISMMLSACAHYHIVKPDSTNIQTIVISMPENLTNEPRLSGYTKNSLTELAALDGTLTVINDNTESDCIISTKIVSYDTQGVGETRISSKDDDQRKYRSTIFRVNVDIEYTLSAKNNDKITSGTVTGSAEFTELVDIDVVKKDGINRAAYDACQQIINNLINSNQLSDSQL